MRPKSFARRAGNDGKRRGPAVAPGSRAWNEPAAPLQTQPRSLAGPSVRPVLTFGKHLAQALTTSPSELPPDVRSAADARLFPGRGSQGTADHEAVSAAGTPVFVGLPEA